MRCVRPSSTTLCLHAVEAVGGTVVPVDWSRASSISTLSSDALSDDVAVVSVMLANNEVGTIQPLAEVAESSARERPARCCIPTPCRRSRGSTWPPSTAVADLVSISAHKFGGPKGVGAFVAREDVQLGADHPRRWTGT